MWNPSKLPWKISRLSDEDRTVIEDADNNLIMHSVGDNNHRENMNFIIGLANHHHRESRIN